MLNIVMGAEAVCIFVGIVVILSNLSLLKYNSRRTKYFICSVGFLQLGLIADFASYLAPVKEMWLLYCILAALSYSTEYLSTGCYLFFLYELSVNSPKRKGKWLKALFSVYIIMSMVMFFIAFVHYAFPVNSLGITEALASSVYLAFEIFLSATLIAGIIANKLYIDTKYWIASWSIAIGLLASALTTHFVEDLDLSFVYANMSVFALYLYIQTNEYSQREKRLTLLSYNDGLTGLYNRNAYALYEEDIKCAGRYEDLWYMSMDLNKLKYTNDTFGHKTGDILICGAAAILKKCLSPSGRVYRMGGDEFAALFYAQKDEAEVLIENLKTMLTEWRAENIDGISCSIGVVSASEIEDVTIEALEKLADERMYAEKRKFHEDDSISQI